jgi:hypothetical protein
MNPDIEKFLPVAILKMAVTIPHKFNIVRFQRHFMWADYDVPKWFLLKSNNVEFVRYCGSHFENGDW